MAKRGSDKNPTLTAQDIDYIGRVVETEVGRPQDAERNGLTQEQYAQMAKAVADTVINRIGSPSYPSTPVGVMEQKRQFSKITGPAKVNPYGSLRATPKANPQTQAIVDRHIAARAKGLPSTIGTRTDYLNIAASDPFGQKWAETMKDPINLGVPGFGHTHGTADWVTPPDYMNINAGAIFNPSNMDELGIGYTTTPRETNPNPPAGVMSDEFAPDPLNAPTIPVERMALPALASAVGMARPEAAIDFVSRIASRPETVGALPMRAADVRSRQEFPGSLPAAPPSYQTDNLASQAMYDDLPMDTYFQDKLEKAAKAENDKIGLASRFPGMADAANRVMASYPPSTGISAAIGGAGRPSAPSVGSLPGTTPAGLGGLNYSVAPASRPSAPPVSAGMAQTPAQLGGLNYSVPPAAPMSVADQYASYGAGKATTNRAPNDTRASAYRSMPPAPVMAAAIDRIDIPGSAKPAAPAISPATLAAQYASYGAGKIAPTQTAASATQSAPKPSQAIAQKAAPPAMSAAPRTVAPRQVTPYAPPAAPAMTPERARALGMVPTPGVPGAYMPNVPGNQAQVMADQAKLIAANPIASIGKMLAGTMLGGVFHAGGGLRNAAQNVAQAVGGNRQQSERDRLANALASVAMGGVGGSFTGNGGLGGGFQASPGGWGNYGTGGFNSGFQSSSGFTYDR